MKTSFQVNMLRKEHFEPIYAQMEHEEEGKISIKDIPDLTDMSKYKAQTSMSKHIRDFETYLSQHYGVECCPPLDYVVFPKLVVMHWINAINPTTTPEHCAKLFQACRDQLVLPEVYRDHSLGQGSSPEDQLLH